MASERDGMTSTEHSPDASAERLASMNTMLAEWAACSAAESASLVERFEAMGYRVRGKSREEIAEVLKRPPLDPSTP
jgi:hypothetical protein